MRVVFSTAALADLEAIADYIRSDNPARATTFVHEILSRCEELAEIPEAFPLVPRFAKMDIRKRTYRDYLIFYRAHEKTIDILHVLHGARDLDSILAEGA